MRILLLSAACTSMMFILFTIPVPGQEITERHNDIQAHKTGARATNVWEGDFNHYWSQALNWSLGHVPTYVENVEIPATYTYYPYVHGLPTAYSAVCHQLTVEAGAELMITNGDLTVGYNMYVYGTLRMNDPDAILTIEQDIFWTTGCSIDITDMSGIYVERDWIFNPGADVNFTQGTVYFSGTADQYIITGDTACKFNDLSVINSSGVVWLHSSSPAPLILNGTLTLNVSTDFQTDSSEEIQISGHIFNFGNLQLDLGMVRMEGTSQQIQWAGTGHFFDLYINPSSLVYLTGDIDVNRDLVIQSGQLDPMGYTIHVGGSWINDMGATGFVETGSRVVFDGTSADSYILGPESFDTLEIDKGGLTLQLLLSSAVVDCEYYDWTSGDVAVSSMATFNANDFSNDGIFGGFAVNSGGTINFTNNDGYVDLNCSMSITDGTVNIYGGTDDSYWGYTNNCNVTMSGGVLDFKDQGIHLYGSYTVTENISGGRIAVTRGFHGAERTDFNPTGGTMEFYGSGTCAINLGASNNFHHVVLDKTATSRTGSNPFAQGTTKRRGGTTDDGTRSTSALLYSDLDINGDLDITNGTLDVSSSNYTIRIAKNWTNNVGSSGFSEESGLVIFDGADSANIFTNETFYDLELDKTYGFFEGLQLEDGITVNVLGDLHITDGCLEMNYNSTLSVRDSLVIMANAGLNAYADTNLSIEVGGHWYNYNTTYDNGGVGFNPGTSEVTFNGSADQKINTAAAAEEFFDLVINKPSGILFRPMDDITVLGDLDIQSGGWYDLYGSLEHHFYGDFTVQDPDGGFYGSTLNTVRLKGSGDQYLYFPPAAGGNFNHLYIDQTAGTYGPENQQVSGGEVAVGSGSGRSGNRSGTVYLNSDLYSATGDRLYLIEGNLDLNGYSCWWGGRVDIYNNSTLNISSNEMLQVGSSLNIQSGGFLEVIGSAGNEATISGFAGNHYYFSVYSGGTIRAEYAIFREMAEYGVHIEDGATIDPSYPFNYCTFEQGSTNTGAALLRIDNDQTITINGANFPDVTPDADFNVKKSLDQGDVTFTNASGAFSGPAYEIDPYDRIHWDEAGDWLGVSSTDWNDANNWPYHFIPDGLTDVTIPAGCTYYPVVPGDLSVGIDLYTHKCNSLIIESGGTSMTVNGTLHCDGNLEVHDLLNVGSNMILDDEAVVNVWDTIYVGNYAGEIGQLRMDPGSYLYQYYGSHIFFEKLWLQSGCDYVGGNGDAHVYNSGTAPVTNTLDIDDADSYFDLLVIESGTNASLSGSSEDLETNYLAIHGDFSTGTTNVNSFLTTVYGNFYMGTGQFSASYSLIFYPGSQLDMSDGMIDVSNFTVYGGAFSITGGDIKVELNFYDNSGLFSMDGGTITFYSDQDGTIYGSPDFYRMTIDKGSYILNGGTTGSGANIHTSEDCWLLSGTFELHTGSVLDIDSILYIEPAGVLDASNSGPIEIRVGLTWNNIHPAPGGFLSGNGSTVIFDNAGTTSVIQQVTERSSFNKIIVDNGSAYVKPYGSGYPYIKADTIDIRSGTLDVSGDLIEVDGKLTVSGFIRMIDPADTLVVKDIVWQDGANDLIIDGTIVVNGNWTWEPGSNAYLTTNNTVKFNGSQVQTIYCDAATSSFNDLIVGQSADSLLLGVGNTEIVTVLGDMTVDIGNILHLQNSDLKVEGVLETWYTSRICLQDQAELEADSTFTLNGMLQFDGGGDVLVHGLFTLDGNGHLVMNDGSMVCDMSYVAPGDPVYLSGQMDMSGTAEFEVSENMLFLQPAFSENITGGSINLGGSLRIAGSGTFQPSGGTVKYIGGVGTGKYIHMDPGNWFHDLDIDGGSSMYLVYGNTSIAINNDLQIITGGLSASTDTIYLAGDWTNVMGSSGFLEGSGLVVLNGINPADTQHIYGESFYDLTNLNTAGPVDIAGATTVSNDFQAGSGGAGCEVLISTSATVDIENLYLPQGSFILSSAGPTVNVNFFDQGGDVTVFGGTLDIGDIYEAYLHGSYTLHSGTINLTQDPSSFIDMEADLDIQGGVFNVFGGSDNSWWSVLSVPHTMNMSAGVLNFQDVGIRLHNNMISYSISGGVIKTGEGFFSSASMNSFQPAGGSVELYGPNLRTVQLGSGSWFYDLIINKSSNGINAISNIHVKNNLDVQNGTFNTGIYEITVGN